MPVTARSKAPISVCGVSVTGIASGTSSVSAEIYLKAFKLDDEGRRLDSVPLLANPVC